MSEPRRFYACGVLKREMEVESNLPFKIHAMKLQWCEGQIGALSVFATREEAEAYSPGSPIIEIEEVNSCSLGI